MSLQCLWLYDYFLTLGDEVWYLPSLSKETSDADRRKGKLCLVWEEILGCVYLRFSQTPTTHMAATQYSRSLLLYDPSKSLAMRRA